MKKVILAVVVAVVAMGAYQSPGVREWVDAHETERVIEARCDVVAECRNVDGEVHCWVIDVDNTIQAYGWKDRPSDIQVSHLCNDISVGKINI